MKTTNSIFHIKHLLEYAFILFGIGLGFTQNIDSIRVENHSKSSYQKSVFFSSSYLQPVSAGSGFLGAGAQGKGGFNFGVSVFIYKNIFVSGNLGSNYFEINDTSITGNYNKSTYSHQYISLGYQFLTTSKFRSGISISLFSNSDIKNKGFSASEECTQDDDTKLRAYEIHFDYLFNPELSIF